MEISCDFIVKRKSELLGLDRRELISYFCGNNDMQRLILATAVADKRKDTQDSWLRDEIHKIVFHHFSPHRLNAQFKRILSFFFQGGKLNCGFNIECKSKIILRRTILVEPHSSK